MADILSNTSRRFYERTKSKLANSLMLGGLGLMFMGFGAYSGGMAQRFRIQSDEYSLDVDDVGAIASSNSQVSGYGFASFCYVTGSVILFIAALYSSPLLCGTVNERRMLKSPTEIHSTDHIEGHNFEKQAPADENA